jgi:dephospho-CoA kinase
LVTDIPDAEKRRRADFVVDSSQEFDHIRAQIRDILQQRRYNATSVIRAGRQKLDARKIGA